MSGDPKFTAMGDKFEYGLKFAKQLEQRMQAYQADGPNADAKKLMLDLSDLSTAAANDMATTRRLARERITDPEQKRYFEQIGDAVSVLSKDLAVAEEEARKSHFEENTQPMLDADFDELAKILSTYDEMAKSAEALGAWPGHQTWQQDVLGWLKNAQEFVGEEDSRFANDMNEGMRAGELVPGLSGKGNPALLKSFETRSAFETELERLKV